MTRLDFYILAEDATPEDSDLVACRLAGKAFGLGHAVYIRTRSREHTRQLDALLWTYQQGSFVPHFDSSRWPDMPRGFPLPVLLGHDGDPPAEYHDLLINTTETVPPFFRHCQRVAELVPGGEPARQRGRERFQHYRDGGHELHTHRL